MKPLLCLLLLCAPVFAQTNQPWRMPGTKKVNQPKPTELKAQGTAESKTDPAAISTADIPIANQTGPLNERLKTFRNSGRFSVKYDRFEDYIRVKVGPFFVGGTSNYVMLGSELEMSASFIKDGKPIDTIYLLFRARGKDWAFLKSRELHALVDGERMWFGEGDWDSDYSRRGISELIIFTVPIKALAQIGKARNAELKIGRVELTLKDEHKEAFRDLLSLLR